MARQSRAPTLLLTRPAPQSQRFAQQLCALLGNVEIVVSPLMQTAFLHPVVPELPFQAVIFTSETGVQAALTLKHRLPSRAFCVGNRTADAARAAGFAAASAEGEVEALAAMILASGIQGPLLHLRGADSAGDLAGVLTKRGLETHFLTVYSQDPMALTDRAADLFQRDQPILIPIFSPRSARLLAQQRPVATVAPLWIVAISKPAAAAAEALSPTFMTIAAHPDGENMLHAVTEAYKSAASA